MTAAGCCGSASPSRGAPEGPLLLAAEGAPGGEPKDRRARPGVPRAEQVRHARGHPPAGPGEAVGVAADDVQALRDGGEGAAVPVVLRHHLEELGVAAGHDGLGHALVVGHAHHPGGGGRRLAAQAVVEGRAVVEERGGLPAGARGGGGGGGPVVRREPDRVVLPPRERVRALDPRLAREGVLGHGGGAHRGGVGAARGEGGG
eukprot:CAMPEP_0182883518 /NCGR_PEP_ID=MMETSP0034_2-20130328/18428_1 /TAXON_ID=156128 /ORGANISM="Nephroselmis pyriformis, Strain CCMP717" /LENGTH=202 /DNA_ID=CAMNT_0025016661 /DNA_START=329 /DNA_END=935 /DNA_ORIENTATION=-